MKQHPTMPHVFVDDRGDVFVKLSGFVEPETGYTQIRIPADGQGPRISERKHRVLWEVYNGKPVPRGKVVRHHDGNPANESPENLVLGTQLENCQDTVRHGRTTRGAKNAAAKLTEDGVRDIRRRRANGEAAKAIADEYEISVQNVCDIHKRRTWAWVE